MDEVDLGDETQFLEVHNVKYVRHLMELTIRG
jgi:hypothetical protein